MSLRKIGCLKAVSASPRDTVADVVRTMETKNVGCVVLVEGSKPVGIVTDRDLVLRVLRRGADPRRLRSAT